MTLSGRINPYEAPAYERCANCGESSEDHGARKSANGVDAEGVFCPCQMCVGRGHEAQKVCPDCDGTGFSDETFEAVGR